jgi:hypothetical protein
MIAPWAIIRRDVGNYIAGINQYIAEAKLDTTKLLVRGGRRARAALRPPGGGACVPRLPRGRGSGRPGDRAARKFPYQVRQRRPRGVARPDPDSLREHEVVVSGPTGGQGLLPSLPSPLSASNALLVSGRESAGGHPLFVAGPQVSYFTRRSSWSRTCTPRRRRSCPGSTRAARHSSASTSTSSSDAAATTHGARRPRGRTTSTPSRSTSASRTARRRPSTRCTTASAAPACRSRCSSARTAGPRRRPTSRHPASRRCAPSARRWA